MMRLLERIENMRLSLGEWLAGFLGVIAIRFFLETFSSPAAAFPAAPDVLTMVHYGLLFFVILISLSLIIRLFVPEISKITKFLLFGFPIIWLPPIVDLVRSGGGGYGMAYLFLEPREFWYSMATFGGRGVFGGITPGIRTEIVCILVGITWYVILKTRNLWKSLAAAVFSYVAIFFWLALPSALAAITSAIQPTLIAADPLGILVGFFSTSYIAGDIVRPVVQMAYGFAVGSIFNTGISLVLYIAACTMLAAWLWAWRPGAARSFWKNARPERMAHYFLLLALGIAIGVSRGQVLHGWFDAVVIADLGIVFIGAWLFAVTVNDIVDIPIDAISNTGRPLIVGSLDVDTMKGLAIVMLSVSFIGAYLLGYWTLFLVTVFTAAYYIYSAPPLRLKRVPMIATFLISIACLATLMAGFYLTNASKLISDFPHRLALIVVIGITLGANIKDIKDVAGDRADGIMTIPAVFDGALGRRIVGIFFAASFLAVPIILRSWPLFFPSLAAAAVGYGIVAFGAYREWKVFAVYFLFFAAAWVMYAIFPVPL